MENFDLEYKLEQFRREHLTDLFDRKGKRYNGVSLSNSQAEIMLELINELEAELIKDDNKGEFEKAVEPAIRYLFKNHNPHTTIVIHYDNAELLVGEKCHNVSSEVPD